jgi:hypothetical protein
MQSGSIRQLDLFLSRYPASPLINIVRREKDRLAKVPSTALPPGLSPSLSPDTAVRSDEIAWQKAKVTRTQEALGNFIHEFPQSERRHEAEDLLASLKPARANRPAPTVIVSPSMHSKSLLSYAPAPTRHQEPLARSIASPSAVAAMPVDGGVNSSHGCGPGVVAHAVGFVPNCNSSDPPGIHQAWGQYCMRKTETSPDGNAFCPPNNHWISKEEAYRNARY